jgi:hypothetical protein
MTHCEADRVSPTYANIKRLNIERFSFLSPTGDKKLRNKCERLSQTRANLNSPHQTYLPFY